MDGIMTVLKGALIGIANIIPGVSGGTLALLLGIYKRIMDALRRVNSEFVCKVVATACFRRGAWRTFWRYFAAADLWFLVWLGGGAVLAILATSRLMTWLLEAHHSASYAFFFGLVLCSIAIPWRYLPRRSWREGLALLLAAVLTAGLGLGMPDDKVIEKAERRQAVAEAKSVAGPDTAAMRERPTAGRLLVIFFAAALAIAAMVLPGISGSFVLLLLGVYFDILVAINTRDFIVLGVFSLGALGGLLLFSRVMSGLLNRCFNVTMAFMTGLMVGSLYLLWPFKRVVQVGGESLYLGNVWRGTSGTEELIVLAAFAAGAALVLGFLLLSRRHARIPGWSV